MNGKFLILFLMLLNFTALLFAFADYETGNEQVTTEYYMINWILQTDELEVSNLDTISDSGSPELSSGFRNATSSLSEPQGAGVSSDTGLFNIIDVIKMIIAFVSLLTPFPAIAYIAVIGASLPIFWVMLLSAIIGFLYLTALAEFVGGRTL